MEPAEKKLKHHEVDQMMESDEAMDHQADQSSITACGKQVVLMIWVVSSFVGLI